MSEGNTEQTTCCGTNSSEQAQKAAAGSGANLPVGSSPGSPSTSGSQSAWAQTGMWSAAFQLPNAPIHTHVLPNGKVLFWGRRDNPDGSMDEHECTPFVWDPNTRDSTPTPQPKLGDSVGGNKVNLFCSGHSFLADGRLLVAGGHIQDGHGDNQVCLYDWRINAWEPLPQMVNGRWYPSAVTLGDGTILVCSGSYFDGVRNTPNNEVPQIWNGQGWRSLAPREQLSLFPRFHLAPDGRVFVCGTNAECFLLDTAGDGNWTSIGKRALGPRDYAPSAMYAEGKVIYIGGGNDDGTQLPTNEVEIIDLNSAQPTWQRASPMNFRRRQHNATILPDGTVLVTGGSQGPGFDALGPGQAVHMAELWDPKTKSWTQLAAEDFDRGYHATAVLLPDATVLSAGGGEGAGAYAERNGQIFHPPYLFRGPRPTITSAPSEVTYETSFNITVSGPQVTSVVWIRLSSVTHAINQNQRINVLEFTADSGGALTITSPANGNVCPPGHYMLFVLTDAGVPSHASIVRISAPGAVAHAVAPSAARAASDPGYHHNFSIKNATYAGIRADRTVVTVGLTSTCPYGLGACWGGAYEALNTLKGVDSVYKVPDAQNSTAQVFLKDGGLPDIDAWRQQFADAANGSYQFRGVEVTLTGVLGSADGRLELRIPSADTTIALRSIGESVKVQWDAAAKQPQDSSAEELQCYSSLQASYPQLAGVEKELRVTGPLARDGGGRWTLYMRRYRIVRH
jgi:galactose oxidase